MKNIKRPTQTVEVRPGVFFDIPVKDSGFSLFTRRIYQLMLILFSPRYAPNRDVGKDTAIRYGQPQEVAYYKAIAMSGLYATESLTFKKARAIRPNLKTILVVGCGTGREAFALEKEGFTVTAYDFCGPMLDAAIELRKKANRSVIFTDQKPVGSFDMVFFTYGLSNHLLSKQARVELIKEWREKIKEDGLLFFGGYHRKIHLFDRFYIASLLLKLRWLFRKSVDHGTTVISHFGYHNDEATPLPFHFYQNREEIEEEVSLAGMTPLKIEIPPDQRDFIESDFLESYIIGVLKDSRPTS